MEAARAVSARPFRLRLLATLMATFLGLAACRAVEAPGTVVTAAFPIPASSTNAPPTDLPISTSTPGPTMLPTAAATSTPQPSATADPEPSPAPPACLEAGGQIEQHRLYTDLSPWPWEFRVYSPPCYQENLETRYPTLILIHGSSFNDDQWDRLGADETADRLIAEGEIPPLLILMPRDRRWVEPVDDPFGQAVVDELLPWLDQNYRTIPDRSYRAIGGLSRGAGWAVHLGLSRWEAFGAIGAHSLAVFWSDTSKLRGWIKEIPPDSLPRIYLDIGEADYVIDSARWFEGVLNELDVPHEWHLFPGRHEEAYWESHLEQYLRWYTADWRW